MKTLVGFISKVIKKIFDYTKNHQMLVVVCLIILFAFILRAWNILNLPKAFSAHEINILSQIKYLDNHGWIIQSQDIFQALYLYFMGLWIHLFGLNFLLLKIIQVLLGTFTVYLFYLFTKEWFNKQIALLASLFLAVDAFHIAVSREIEPAILVPLILVLMLYVITLALRNNRYIWFALSGILVGLALYVSQIFFFLPIVFLLSFVVFFRKNKKIFTAYWKKYLLAAVFFFLAATPFIIYLPQNIAKIFDSFNPGSFGQYFMNIGTIVQSLLYQSIPAQLYYVGLEPILNPFVAIAFLCGLVYAIFHIERRKYFFVVILLTVLTVIIGFMPTQMSINYIILLPVCFILASIILDYFLTTWLKTFPFNRSARMVLAFLLSFLLFLTVYYNYQKYFYAWGKNEKVQSQFTNTFDYKQ
jgi:4-amino-4-deoxy-L-arabinose transferase-like glycosyltransferase